MTSASHVLERHGRLERDPDGGPPDSDVELRQAHRGGIEVARAVHALRAPHAPVELERPAVIRALERLARAAADGDGAAAVQADVRDRVQLAIAPARDDDLLAGDLAGEVLAGLGDLLGPPDEVPHLAEERALLES